MKRRVSRLSACLVAALLAAEGALVHLAHHGDCASRHHHHAHAHHHGHAQNHSHAHHHDGHHHGHSHHHGQTEDRGESGDRAASGWLDHQHASEAFAHGECLACQLLAQRSLHASYASCEFCSPLRRSLQLDHSASLNQLDRLTQCARGPPRMG